MCAWITIKALTDEGAPHPDAPGPTIWEGDVTGADSCTCPLLSINSTGEDAQRVLTVFLKTILPYFETVGWGDIIIEVR